MKIIKVAATFSPDRRLAPGVSLSGFSRMNRKAIYLLLPMMLLISTCKKKNETRDCGCGGNPRGTITESQALVGYLMKSEIKNVPGNINQLPDSKYGIFYAPAGCLNCAHSLFICNDAFLSNLGEIPPYPGIRVKFAGQLKWLCNPIVAPSDVTYDHIELTKIEKY